MEVNQVAVLPGVKTLLSDRRYTLTRTDTATGPRVLAIGTRDTSYDPENGITTQDYDPYLATNEKDVIKQFGEGSHLHKAFLELVSGGAPRVFLVALPSDTVDDDLIDESDGNRFDLAFEAAETALPDIIVPYGRGANSLDWDDYADPATPGGADQFGFVADNSAGADSLVIRVANKVAEINERSNPCIAIMGVAPWVGGGENMTAADVADHFQFTNLVDRDTTLADKEDGTNNNHYVSVVAAEMRPLGFPLEFGWTNGAAHYAGFVASLRSNSSTTGKKIYNVQGLRYNPNRTQREAMVDKGLVPVGLDFARNPLWIDGTTFGKSDSDYVRLTTLRIVFETIRMVREVAQKFIGEPTTLENRNAFETGITSGLRSFQITGGLLGSDFVVSYYPRSNSANVDLVLIPAFELRNININISVAF